MKARLLSRVLLVATAVALALSLSGASREATATDWCAGGVCQEWVDFYDSPEEANPLENHDKARALAVDGAGNVYVTGYTSWVGGYYPQKTLKLDALGVKQSWTPPTGARADDVDAAADIAVDASGNVYVTGLGYNQLPMPPYTFYFHWVTGKGNASGATEWSEIYAPNVDTLSAPAALAVDGAGNVYVTGYSFGVASYDYTTVKYNASGVQQWASRYNGPGNSGDYAAALAVDGSGNAYVTGYSTGSDTGYDYATVKYNASGVEQWAIRYGGSGDDRAQDLAVDGAGNVYVTGYRFFSVPKMDDYVTIKYNASGIPQWTTPYHASMTDRPSSLALDQSGNVYVTGYTFQSGEGNNYTTVKYNSGGTQQWAATYNGPVNGDDQAQEVAVDSSGNVYVTGYSHGGPAYDYATVKYNASGVQQWEARYDDPAFSDDRAQDLAVDGAGNVYVTGFARGSRGNYDYATVKYSQAPAPTPNPAVGGIAELPVLPGASAGEAGARRDGSGWSAGGYAALAGGLAAVALFIAGGGWYARRRWRAG